MKKKSALVTFILATVIIVIGYFIYQKYLAPLYANNLGQTVTVNLSNDHYVSLGKIPGQEHIFGIEIEISGQTQSNFGIGISNTEALLHNARIKGGKKIDFIYKNDWYADSLFLVFDTENNENGQLKIDYRFLGMK